MTTPPFTASDLAELKRLHALCGSPADCGGSEINMVEAMRFQIFTSYLIAHSSAIIAALETAQEDAKRLDSIPHGWRISCEEGSMDHPDRWYIWTTDWSQPLGEGPTLRAAIDAARKGAQ